jgi:hypothetical protein
MGIRLNGLVKMLRGNVSQQNENGDGCGKAGAMTRMLVTLVSGSWLPANSKGTTTRATMASTCASREMGMSSHFRISPTKSRIKIPPQAAALFYSKD